MSTFLVRRTAVACAALGLLAACSSSKSLSSGSSDATSTTAAPATVPATVPPTTAVADTVAPTIPPAPPACGDVTAPTGAAEAVTTIDGDWNGDGVADVGVSWAEPGGGGVLWFVRAEVSGGQSSTIPLGDLGAGYAQAIDNVDVDFALGAEPGVNRDEILAVVGGGASGLNLGIFGVDSEGCIFQFDDGAGSSFVVPIAASIGQMSGLTCDGAMGSQFLVALHASTVDDVNWDTVDYRIERQGERSLVFGVALPGTLLNTDPLLEMYGQAQCGGALWIGGGE